VEKLTPKTSVHELVREYPFLVDFLVSYNAKFGLLKSKVMRATVGRVATLRKIASIGEVELDALMTAIRDEIEKWTGRRLDIDSADDGPAAEEDERVEAMRRIIRDLHDGVPFEEVKRRFDDVIHDAAPEEIAQVEERLIREGMPVEEVQRLCNLHVGVFKRGLEKRDEVQAPPGHPVHTYMAENEVITGRAGRLGELLARLGDSPGAESLNELKSELAEVVRKLGGLDSHYVRKENQLFPFLEKHGVTGPSQVMWGVHDEIRGRLKAVRAALDGGELDRLVSEGSALARAAVEMVYKENKILFPLALEKLTRDEWAAARRGDDELGYAFGGPAAPWPPEGELPTATGPRGDDDMFELRTGKLSLAQLTLMLTHLPVDLTFVDADGFVRFYSDSPERIFPRSPAVIGRHVEKCHPPKSLDKVMQIVSAFKTGEKDGAEFWMQMNERFIYIRYFAVRDDAGEFMGTLEVSQDVTDIRQLQGERRLLDWEPQV
jgi:PAS domain S-box-containing protein